MIKNRKSKLFLMPKMDAFVAVMIALLFLFMGNVTLFMPGGINVAMAKVRHPKRMLLADREDAVIVAVMRDGSIFFDSDRISPERLAPRIRDAISRSVEKKVYIKADARARYGAVKEALDGVRSSGVESIAFLTESSQALPGH